MEEKSALRQWIDRRRAPRVALNTQITLESEDNLYAGLSQDLSSGGVFVSAERLLPIGSQGWVTFEIPTTKRRFKVKVEVRWVRDHNPASDTPAGMGLQFVDIQDDDLRELERFIEFRLPLLYEQ